MIVVGRVLEGHGGHDGSELVADGANNVQAKRGAEKQGDGSCVVVS